MTATKKTRQSRASVTSAAPATTRKPAPARTTARPAAKKAPPRAAKKRPEAVVRKSAAALEAHADKTKPKLVRDSFTIPKSEYAVLESLKLRAASLTRPVKKSELLRAGIAALSGMGDQAFLAALNGVPSLKTGRPKGSGANAA